MTEEKITLTLINEDFTIRLDGGDNYTDNYDCPIARAVKRQFPSARVIVSSYGDTTINGSKHQLPFDSIINSGLVEKIKNGEQVSYTLLEK